MARDGQQSLRSKGRRKGVGKGVMMTATVVVLVLMVVVLLLRMTRRGKRGREL